MNNKNQQIIVVRPSWRSVWPAFAIIALIISVVTGVLYVLWLLQSSEAFFESVTFTVVAFLPLLCAVLLARPLFRRFDSYLEISPHHVRFSGGRLSLKKEWLEFTYEDLLGVEIHQSLCDRVLGLGTIAVGTAMRSTPELLMRGVKHPHQTASLIGDRIDHARIMRDGANNRTMRTKE